MTLLALKENSTKCVGKHAVKAVKITKCLGSYAVKVTECLGTNAVGTNAVGTNAVRSYCKEPIKGTR